MAVVATLGPVPLLVIGVILFASAAAHSTLRSTARRWATSAWSRPARLTLLHAAFSGGGVLGAIGAGVHSSEADCRCGSVYPVLVVSLVAVAILGGHCDVATAASARRDRCRARIALAMLPSPGIAGLAFLVEGWMEA